MSEEHQSAAELNSTATLLAAARFAASRHSGQHRKGHTDVPYINHPLAVTEILARVGAVTDNDLLVAALLHDTVEDTETTPQEIEEIFGFRVRTLVEEVTDDKSLPKERRKELQVIHAPEISDEAKTIKLSDKICNIRDVAQRPPVGWSLERRREYLDWTERVIAGCRGVNEELERLYDRELTAARALLDGDAAD